MDLSSLDSTLPPALADAERDMGDKFRGMSRSILMIFRGACYWSGWNVNDGGLAGNPVVNAHGLLDPSLTDSVRTEYHKHVQIVPWVYEGKLALLNRRCDELTG